MSEFRVAFNEASQRKRDGKIRLAAWGTILLLSVATVVGILSVRSSRPQVNTAFIWFAALLVLGAIVGAHFVAVRLGLERVERDMVFVLTDKDLVRKRNGWPDVRINFSEISALYERPGWLVVEGSEPPRKIAVPDVVEGFAAIRAELAKHGTITAQPRSSPLGLVTMLASFLCWGAVLWSKDAGVLRIAAALALILLAWESFRFSTRLRQSPKRFLVWVWIGLGWVAAILVVYFRVLRGF